jgi:hypothetical protein
MKSTVGNEQTTKFALSLVRGKPNRNRSPSRYSRLSSPQRAGGSRRRGIKLVNIPSDYLGIGCHDFSAESGGGS